MKKLSVSFLSLVFFSLGLFAWTVMGETPFDPPAWESPGWRPISGEGAPSFRMWPTAVWTGDLSARHDKPVPDGKTPGGEMIVWGGFMDNWDYGGDWPYFKNDGARYDPARNKWRPTSTAGAPLIRAGHTAVWAPEIGKMLVWGGVGYTYYNDGGMYDPATDSWTPIPATGAPGGRAEHTAVWTGKEMIVWGGFSFALGDTNTGGAYNPATNTWRILPTEGAPMGRYAHTAVWTGSSSASGGEMIIWGGQLRTPPYAAGDGAAYNPETNTWRPLSNLNAPAGRTQHTAVWTGSSSARHGAQAFLGGQSPDGEMIIWGGAGGCLPYGCYLNDGARYNPKTDSWTPLSMEGAPTARRYHQAVWTGDSMLIWGGVRRHPDVPWGAEKYFRFDGGIWTPGRGNGGTWKIFWGQEPKPRAGQMMVWTGQEMLIWGGEYGDVNDNWVFLNDGWKFNPNQRPPLGGSFQFWDGR